MKSNYHCPLIFGRKANNHYHINKYKKLQPDIWLGFYFRLIEWPNWHGFSRQQICQVFLLSFGNISVTFVQQSPTDSFEPKKYGKGWVENEKFFRCQFYGLQPGKIFMYAIFGRGNFCFDVGFQSVVKRVNFSSVQQGRWLHKKMSLINHLLR